MILSPFFATEMNKNKPLIHRQKAAAASSFGSFGTHSQPNIRNFQMVKHMTNSFIKNKRVKQFFNVNLIFGI